MFALGVISVLGSSLLAGEGQLDSSLENESYGARGGGGGSGLIIDPSWLLGNSV